MAGATLRFRTAERADLEVLVRMLADDPLGATRETVSDPLPEAYRRAFDAITNDPNHELIVATDQGAVVGMLQLSLVPSITRRGTWRGQIEGVRVASDARSRGVGRRLVEHAVARATERGCGLVQLTTDRTRPDAKRFYEAIGFSATHDGMKLELPA